MRVKDPAKRYEINRKIKAVLIRHAVDLMQLQYSNSGDTVYIFGKLEKEPRGEFAPPEVESMIRDLAGIEDVTDIQFDLSNWSLLYEPGFIEIRTKR
jgi:hypothetical protein